MHREPNLPLFSLILSLLFFLSACSLQEIRQQSLRVDDHGTVSGRVEIRSQEAGQAYVLLFNSNEETLEAINIYPLSSDGSYLFYAAPDMYTVGAFVDLNGDRQYQPGEPAAYLGMENVQPTMLTLASGDTVEVETLVVEGEILRRSKVPMVAKIPDAVANIGKVVSLEDPRFSSENAAMGMWRPFDFITDVGAGLFMLQPFDEGKVPIIFVHGINGTATNFSDVVAGLDLEQVQPWVLYYPSGIRLDMVSDYLLRAVTELGARHPFNEVYIVAHSMGGLMTRSFVMKHQQHQSRIKLGLVVTVNSPLYGMDSAASGVKHSPVVVPSWRDVASESDYVKRVHSQSWPANVPYHLVFSYQKGEDGDGVVPINSQLSMSLQREATRIYGFEAEHSKILLEPQFISLLNEILSDTRVTKGR